MLPNRTKDLLFVLIITFLASLAAGLLVVKINNWKWELDFSSSTDFFPKHSQANLLKIYTGGIIGLQFQYPQKLTLTEDASTVALEHQIPHKNSGDCDMKGGAETFNNLTDFKVSFKIFDGTVAQAVTDISPYIPKENFTGNTLKISQGFIDEYKVGNLFGFAIVEGAEGCGQTIYYFPISGNRVLVVQRASIQALSSIIVKEKRDEVLAVPGVISAEENEQIFKQILGSVNISSQSSFAKVSENTPLLNTNVEGWKTYRNTKYNYEFKYPENVGIMNEETSIYAGPPTNTQEDLLLITDKEGTFHFQINDGILYRIKESPLGQAVLATLKFTK